MTHVESAIDIDERVGARSNHKFCAHLTSHVFPVTRGLSEDSLLFKIASRHADLVALLLKPANTLHYSLSVVFDLRGIPALVEIDYGWLKDRSTIAQRKVERMRELRRAANVSSAATKSLFAVSTLETKHVARHFPLVPERHAAIFGLAVSARGCSITVGYDQRWLSDVNAATMLDLVVSLLTD